MVIINQKSNQLFKKKTYFVDEFVQTIYSTSSVYGL